MNRYKLLAILLVIAAVGLFFAFDLGRYLSLDGFKSQQAAIEAWRAANPLAAGLAFFAAYVAVTALS
ncbi:MAG: hypothetical protein K8F56_10445, partial [Rhodocyclaceae bacterium]|nr:hypothetical protein [Rhodocyclaceae bacterium]